MAHTQIEIEGKILNFFHFQSSAKGVLGPFRQFLANKTSGSGPGPGAGITQATPLVLGAFQAALCATSGTMWFWELNMGQVHARHMPQQFIIQRNKSTHYEIYSKDSQIQMN